MPAAVSRLRPNVRIFTPHHQRCRLAAADAGLPQRHRCRPQAVIEDQARASRVLCEK
ncbi:hypothetical protein M8494_27085 [Serratia ureilytica]